MTLDDLAKAVDRALLEYDIKKSDVVPGLVTVPQLLETIKKYAYDYSIEPVVRRVLRKQFRTWIPDAEGAFRLERKGLIDRGKLNRIFAVSGIEGEVDSGVRPDWADIAYADMFKVLDYNTLLEAARDVEPERTWLDKLITRNLYGDDDISQMSKLVRYRAIKDQVEEYLYAKFDEIDLGVCGEGDFDLICSTLGLGTTGTTVAKARLKSKLVAGDVKLRKDVEATRLTYGLIDPEDYVDRVIAVGVDPARANAEAELIMAQRGIIWEPPG